MNQPASAAGPAQAYIAAAEQVIIAMPVGRVFINADVIAALRAHGWPEPPELRGMGSMLLRLRKRGYVEKIGNCATPARSHGGVTSQWRRTSTESEFLELPHGGHTPAAHARSLLISLLKRGTQALRSHSR